MQSHAVLGLAVYVISVAQSPDFALMLALAQSLRGEPNLRQSLYEFCSRLAFLSENRSVINILIYNNIVI